MLQNMQAKATEKFKELDTDSNGGLDKTELSTMAKELSKMTGKTLNVDDTMTTYDANSDGQLSQDETDTMMKQVLGPPPGSGGNEQAMKAYQANSGEDDQLSALLKMREEAQSSFSTSGTSSTSSFASDQFSALLDILNQTADSTSIANSRPNPEEMFKKLDSDGSSSLNKTELDVWAKDFASMTGQTVDTTQAINTYDTDGDGALNTTEMDTMVKTLHEKSGANAEQVNSGNDQFSQLLQLLEKYTANQSTEISHNLTSYV
jgi:Ca2+-binding EF-hand superfamily protein